MYRLSKVHVRNYRSFAINKIDKMCFVIKNGKALIVSDAM
jgi:hypothetical protein